MEEWGIDRIGNVGTRDRESEGDREGGQQEMGGRKRELRAD